MQWLPLSRHTAQTSPGTTRFFLSIHLPHLSYLIPCSYWASTCIAALPSCMTLYEISVRQTRDLPVVSLFPHPASFRFHLTVDTLAFGYILPTTGRIRDFNPLETCAAGRTTKKSAQLTATHSIHHLRTSAKISSRSFVSISISNDFNGAQPSQYPHPSQSSSKSKSIISFAKFLFLT